MRIPLDISHRLIVEDLDTGKRQVFLIPRGKTTPIEVSQGDGIFLGEVLDSVGPVADPEKAVPEVVAEVHVPAARPDVPAELPLVEGTLSDDVDPFGAAQG